MRKPFASLMTGLVLLATVVVPPLGMALGASSMAAGVLLVVGLYVFLFAAVCALNRPRQSLGNVAFIVTVALAVVFTQGVLSFLINATFNIDRFSQTYAFCIIYILGASFLALLAQRLPKRKADFAVKFVFYALLLSGFASIFGYRAFGNPSAVGFFSENSHYALAFLPLLLYMVVLSSLSRKWLFTVMGVLMALLLQSLTLLVGVVLVAMFAFRLRQLVFLALIATISLVAVDPMDIVYYSSRIDLSREDTNLSTLSYMHGWERAYLNLKDYYGMGVGFQQLGFVGSEGEILGDLTAQGAEDLNILDGSFVASKFISEFGILAVAALLAYLVYFARSARRLHEVSMNVGGTADCRKVFFLACFVMFFIEFFIRGTGYFSSSGFLFIASLAWIALDHPSNSGLQMSKQTGVVQ